MKLHPDQKEQIRKYVQQKWKLDVCPLCRARETYTIAEQVYQLTEYPEMGLLRGQVVAPIIPLTCNNCGNTFLINALVAKIDLGRRPGWEEDMEEGPDEHP